MSDERPLRERNLCAQASLWAEHSERPCGSRSWKRFEIASFMRLNRFWTGRQASC
jgi:hypothetical protein